jgi:endonuclease YncB( thermonuclease family)
MRRIGRTVKRVVDGDTLEVYRRVNGSRYVRLSGVYAPEKREPGYARAKGLLRRMVENKRITVQPVGKSYGRTVANIYRQGKSVNKEMKRKGYR